MRSSKQIILYPFAIYFWVAMGIALVGLMVAVYLSISHYRVYTDMTYRSFCALTKSINCDTVSQSPYAIMLGLPLPFWGIFGYAFVLLFIWFGRPAYRHYLGIWPLVFMISAIFSVHSLVLAYISTFRIHSYCIMCILSYGVNFLLLFYSWLIHRRFANQGILVGLAASLKSLFSLPVKLYLFLGLIGIIFGITWLGLPRYWHLPPPANTADIARGYTKDGDPWIGATDPELTIVEYADYRCFQCRKIHHYLRNMMARHPDKIRLVHRHFPMDHLVNPLVGEPMHEGSGKLSLLAIYAGKHNKFWEMNDILFRLDSDLRHLNMRKLAQEAGFDSKGLPGAILTAPILKKLEADIIKGIQLGIEGTPGYLINGNVYTAQIPPEILKPYLE